MKRNLLVGGVVALVIALIAVRQCRSSDRTGPSRANTSQTGSAGSKGTTRDRLVDPRTLQRASITGTVTDEAKAPVAGARVCGDAASHRLAAAVTRDPSCATTDASGRYTLPGLVPARYVVAASAKQFQPATFRVPDGPPGRSYFNLAAGEAKTGVDITLRRGGVEITGTVSDITGGPVAQAAVRAQHDWDGAPSPPVETGADGTFSLWAEPGRTIVSATADGYASGYEEGRAPGTFDVLLTPASSFAGRVIDAVSSEPVAGIRVVARATEGWDGGDDLSDITDDTGAFRIERMRPNRYVAVAEAPHGHGRTDGSTLVALGQQVDGVIIKLHAAMRISGTVVKPDGTVCKDSSLNVVDKTRDGWVRTETEPDGEVHADGLLAGPYDVSVDCEGFLAKPKYESITLADKDVDKVVWSVDAGATIRGRLVTKRGEPVSDAELWARTVGGAARARQGGGSTRTATDGSYALSGLIPASYKIEASSDRGRAPSGGWPVELAAGLATVDKELVLDETGAITGTVVDSDGKPVGSMEVAAISVSGRFEGSNSSKTGSDGTFAIENVAAGEYRVMAMRSWRSVMRRPDATDNAKKGERVTVALGKSASVRIVVETLTGVITGSVVDTAGTPAPDAYVRAVRESDAAGAQSAVVATRWSSDSKPVITSTDGTFSLSKLAPGSYTLRAYIKGGGEGVIEHVPVGGTAKIQIAQTGSIAGTVTGGTGAIDDLLVDLRAPKIGLSRRERFFRTGGTFTLRDLPAASYTLTVSSGSGKKQVPIELAAGETKTGIAITLDALVTLTGRIVDQVTKQPVAGMRMMASIGRDGGGGFSARDGLDPDEPNVSGEDGRFTIEGAPSGAVMLRGFPKDWRDSEYVGISQVREVAGTGTIDIGDIVALKKRVKDGDKVGDHGIKFADDPPGTPMDQRVLKVAYLDPQGPAAKVGLEVGDIVITIDGNDITGGSSSTAWTLMRAPPGTKLTLGLKRGTSVSLVLAAP